MQAQMYDVGAVCSVIAYPDDDAGLQINKDAKAIADVMTIIEGRCVSNEDYPDYIIKRIPHETAFIFEVTRRNPDDLDDEDEDLEMDDMLAAVEKRFNEVEKFVNSINPRASRVSLLIDIHAFAPEVDANHTETH